MHVCCASAIFLYFSQVVHLENLSLGLFKMFFLEAVDFFYHTQHGQNKMRPHLIVLSASLMFVIFLFYFFHFVHVGNFRYTTFSFNINGLVLWGITLAKGTMMIERVAMACSVASLGLLVPKLPWNHERRPMILFKLM